MYDMWLLYLLYQLIQFIKYYEGEKKNTIDDNWF